MENIRIVFMGTPDFAVATLDALVQHNYTVVGVVTAPDRPAGRGQKLSQSAVKKYALDQNIPVLQPTNLKSENFLEQLKALNGNLQIVVAFRMLPKVVWSMPALGTFNLHASLLPQYRGAAPINWAIINGEKETGVTTFFIDDKIDTGEIILQEKITIEETETAGMLHDKLMTLGATLVVKTVSLIAKGNVTTQKQPETTTLKSAYKIHRDTCKIDWSASIHTIYNHIRGLSPYPAAWTTMVNGADPFNIKVYTATKEIAEHHHAVGTVIHNKNEIKVAVKEGFIGLEEIQLPGKKKMDAKSILNGLKIDDTAHVL